MLYIMVIMKSDSSYIKRERKSKIKNINKNELLY